MGVHLERLLAAFTDRVGAAPDGLWSAPGRVNLIGEHTDYNDGFVFPMAIEPEVRVVCRARDDARVRLASAAPGYEFVDWGGADHLGGGSHGSLHRDDSEGVLLLCGVDAPARDEWALTDVTGLVLEHFGVPLTR